MHHTISFYVKAKTKTAKKGTIYSKVIFADKDLNKISIQTTTGVQVEKKSFLSGRGAKTYAKRGNIDEGIINATVKKVSASVRALFESLDNEGKLPSKGEIKQAVLKHNPNEVNSDFWAVVDHYLEALKNKASSDTHKNNRNSLIGSPEKIGHLKNFEITKKYPLSFETINKRFEEKYLAYLMVQTNPTFAQKRAEPIGANRYKIVPVEEASPKAEEIGLLNDTMNKHFAIVKAFMKWAFEHEYHTETAYQAIKLPPKSKQEPIRLTQQEVKRLEKYQPPKHQKYLQRARDFLLFAIYTGQRFSDVSKFSKDQLRTTAQGSIYWRVEQFKTRKASGKAVKVPMHWWENKAIQILESNNYQFSKISNQKLNKYLKQVCKNALINTTIKKTRWCSNKEYIFEDYKFNFICSHTGRRTFASIMMEEAHPMQNVMKATGHTNMSTFQRYVGADEDYLNEKPEIVNNSIAN